MALSNDLISQFVKTTRDDKKVSKETTVYGTIRTSDGRQYVQLDGSELYTPVSTTANVQDGERVTVMIKDHTATVTGNISSPAVGSGELSSVFPYEITAGDSDNVSASLNKLLEIIGNDRTELNELKETVIKLREDLKTGEELTQERLDTIKDTIANVESTINGFSKEFETEDFKALNAEITNLKGYVAEFTYLSAINAKFDNLDVKYADIDFANIGELAVRKIFAESGIIRELAVGDQTITGELVGVTIKGNLIEGNTIVADKLVVRGEDGLYYKLNMDGESIEAEQTDQNSLNGSVITAKSITATKITVDDLVAFDATIGGFQITERSIHSVGKPEIDSPTQGVHLDREGQFAVGDGDNHIKYFRDANGNYKLNISAESITSQIKSSTDPLKETVEGVQKHIQFTDDGITISAGENKMSLRLDNDVISFEKDGVPFGWWDGVNFNTGNIMVNLNERAQFGNFAFVPRSDGSISFLKVADNSGVYAMMSPTGIMTIYGLFPTLNDSTMVVDEGLGELNGTTLVIGGR